MRQSDGNYIQCIQILGVKYCVFFFIHVFYAPKFHVWSGRVTIDLNFPISNNIENTALHYNH